MVVAGGLCRNILSHHYHTTPALTPADTAGKRHFASGSEADFQGVVRGREVGLLDVLVVLVVDRARAVAGGYDGDAGLEDRGEKLPGEP